MHHLHLKAITPLRVRSEVTTMSTRLPEPMPETVDQDGRAGVSHLLRGLLASLREPQPSPASAGRAGRRLGRWGLAA